MCMIPDNTHGFLTFFPGWGQTGEQHVSDTLQEAEVCIAVEISKANLQDIYLPFVLKKSCPA